ncbi:phage tail protein [Pseudomonas sp. MPR-ANC1]|uniref:phage tail protein n=1 Tax=Pseudomonas sp. MPR-ANC1 TaxID=2075548 RepID=UPI000CD1F3C2|nr:phage tail protein [Pseudomonas sp. MPR-ANC1]POA42518.1 phage tail protein [Pseudomonas sp. MPR-ANC1]
MIDANSQFFAILTNVGMAKQANADALGIPWKLTEMGVGDANPGGLADPPNPIPSAAQNKLLNEWRRKPLNQLRVDPVNPAVIIAEQIIPADEGGKWIREIGLYDADGDLVAVANCAPSFKPLLSQGSGRTQVVRMNFVVSNTGNITLKIDPAVVLATREYVDSRILDELSRLDIKQSVRAATTANIALSGLQVVDGVSLNAGDRVLVKNQAVAKDNGPYVVAAGAWARAKDADSNVKVTPNMTLAVEVGATQADTIWQLVTDGAIVVGVTPLVFKDITDGLARLFSPIFVGSPMAPTPAQFDTSKLLATAEFVKRSGVEFSGFTSNSADLALTAAHVGGLHSFSNAGQLTATLPPSASIAQGATVTLACAGAGGLRVVGAGTDVVYTSTGVTGPILMALGDTAEFIRLQDQWRLIGGTVALRYAAVMSGPNFLTQPQFDSSLRLATTEFVQRGLGNLRAETAVSSSTTLGANAIGQLIVGGGSTPFTTTLPLASSVPGGSQIHFMATNPVSTWIVQRQGADILDNYAGGTYIVIGLGDSAVFESNGVGTWRLIGGSASLRKCDDFAASLLANGHQKLPTGLIIQWGQGLAMPNDGNDGASAGVDTYITFPRAFPNACASVVATHFGHKANLSVIARNISTTRFTAETPDPNGAQSVRYLAIGY